MGTYEFSPLYRSTVGFDRVFDMLDRVTEPHTNSPPYNIEKKSEDQYFILEPEVHLTDIQGRCSVSI